MSINILYYPIPATISANQTWTGANIFQGQTTFTGLSIFTSGDPWVDVIGVGGKGNSSFDNTTVLNTMSASAASGGPNSTFWPSNTTGGYYFNSKPSNFGSGLNLTSPYSAGAAFGFGTIIARNYSEGTDTNGFLSWDGSNSNIAGNGGGIDGATLWINSGFSGGSFISLTGASSTSRSGFVNIRNVKMSGAGSVAHGIYLDGSAITASGTQGIRDTFLTNVAIFQTTTDAIHLINAAHFFGCGVLTSPTSGTADIVITGSSGSTSMSQAVQFANTEVGGNVLIDYANNVNFTGIVTTNYESTANATNTMFAGSVNGNVTLDGAGCFFGNIGGTLTVSSYTTNFYFTNLGSSTPGPILSAGGYIAANTAVYSGTPITGSLATATASDQGTIFFGSNSNLIRMQDSNFFVSWDGGTHQPFIITPVSTTGADLAVATSIEVGAPTGGSQGAGTINVAAGVYLNGSAYSPPSDARLKTDVSPVTNGLDIVLALKPVRFAWTEEGKNLTGWKNDHYLGFIAQEVEQAIPEAAKPYGVWKSFDERAIIAALVGAVQELQAEIKILKVDNDDLRARLVKAGVLPRHPVR